MTYNLGIIDQRLELKQPTPTYTTTVTSPITAYYVPQCCSENFFYGSPRNSETTTSYFTTFTKTLSTVCGGCEVNAADIDDYVFKNYTTTVSALVKRTTKVKKASY